MAKLLRELATTSALEKNIRGILSGFKTNFNISTSYSLKQTTTSGEVSIRDLRILNKEKKNLKRPIVSN